MNVLKSLFYMGFLIIPVYGAQLTEIDGREIIDETYSKILGCSAEITVPFYRITKNDDPHEVSPHYLFGTYHVLPKKLFKEEILQAITGSNILVTEIYTTKFRDYPELCEFSEFSREDIESMEFLWNESSSWTSLLHRDHLKLIREGIEPTLKEAWGLELNDVHPALVSFLVGKNIEMQKLFTNPLTQNEETIDTFITEEFGLNAGKEIIGLENYKDRLMVSDDLKILIRNKKSLSLEEIIKGISEDINLADEKHSNIPMIREQQIEKETERCSLKKLNQEMIDAYFVANLDYFTRFIISDTIARNRIWLPHLKKIMQSNPAKQLVIMVGVAHLAGEEGLVNLLEKEGYNVILQPQVL